MLRRERKLIDNIRNLGLTGQQAALLLGHPKVASAKNGDEPPRFDWRDKIEEGKVIIWLNDLEKDARYEDLPSELTSLLQRTYPGQLPSIRRNIFTLVVPVDLTNPGDVTVISNLFTFVERLLPVRFGLVPLTPSDDKAAQTKVSEEQAERIKLAQHWVKRLNAGTTIPPFFLDGLLLPRDKGWLRTMSMKIGGDLQTIQRGIYMGLIEEDEWVPGRFLKGALSRRNSYIFPEDEKSIQILDVNKIYAEHDNLFSAL
ncbi:UDP-glucose:glycoprotein glucosyltransferase like [Verticillium longisporum]|nr:UDP-glucose:glycoprotein glucosyltransferase like [Verticillium longisporum]